MGALEDDGLSTAGHGGPPLAAALPSTAAQAPARGAVAARAHALLEVLDRDGQPRQSTTVTAWPLRIGRALDNDVVLADPHVAAHHLVIEAAADGALALVVGDTRNGVQLGRRRLAGGASAALTAGAAEPIEFSAGRTQLRLRLPDQALPAELLLAPAAPLSRRAGPIVLTLVAVLAATLFATWLSTDPEAWPRAAGNVLLTNLAGGAAWCTVWALLSKTFTRQAHFGWHVRVFLIASLGLLVVNNLPPLLAFALSWPALSDFGFIGSIVVTATAFYFHLLAVEPARHRLLKWVAATCGAVGIALSLWFNVQRSDQYGDELYMSHLFPPALRLARPVPTDAFVGGLAPLEATLEKKAKEPARGDEGGRDEE